MKKLTLLLAIVSVFAFTSFAGEMPSGTKTCQSNCIAAATGEMPTGGKTATIFEQIFKQLLEIFK